MAAPSGASSDVLLRAAWDRNYRLGLRIMGVGAVVLLAALPLGLWANSTGNFPASFGAGLVGTAGFLLIVLGGSWVYTNRRMLR